MRFAPGNARDPALNAAVMPHSFPSRRSLIGAGGALASLALTPRAGRAAEPRRPNIVFILADDPGFADVSSYGRTDHRTPNIDRLAEQGLRFMQA